MELFADVGRDGHCGEEEIWFVDMKNAVVMLTTGLKSSLGGAIALLALIGCLCGNAKGQGNCVPAQTAYAGDPAVSVTLSDKPLLLAQPAQITVSVTEGSIKSISLYQKNKSGGIGNTSSGVDINANPRILRDEGQTKIVEFVPVQIGAGAIDVDVDFMDGRESVESCPIHVGASAKGLKTFSLDRYPLTTSVDIYLSDTEKKDEKWLNPETVYEQLDNPIYLTHSAEIKFAVEQPEDNPVIRLDSDGLIHVLRPGTATIIGDFDGVQASLKVEVYAKGYVLPEMRSR